MTKLVLKNYLLSTDVFINNKYLDEYIDLILNNTNIKHKGYCENHHVLPAVYYKHLYNCKKRYQSDSYAKKDKNNFIVKLLYKDHCKAHWLLYFCTKDYMKQANEAAVRYISSVYLKLTGKEKHKFDFMQEDFDLLQNYMNDIIVDKESRYWTPEEIIYLQENYTGYGAGPRCAKYLNRSLCEVNSKARLLGLRSSILKWTIEELNILKEYYPIEGTKVYKRLPNHSEAACKAQAVKLQIKTKNHYWSEAEIKVLKDNFSKLGPAGCSKLLNRNKCECKHKAQRLNLVYNGPRKNIWTKERLDLLYNNLDLSIYKLKDILNLSYGCISKKLKEIKDGKNNETRESKD